MENYCTKDISIAAYLYASHKNLAQLKNDNDKRVVFIFEDGPDCEKLVKLYWKREGSIIPKDFADGLRSIKDMLFKK